LKCNWSFFPAKCGREPNELSQWSETLKISRFLVRLLWYRGFNSLEEMDVFLAPGLRHLSPLEEWKEIWPAAGLLASAVRDNKKIAVWGDYDVDGLTSTALAVHFLRQCGCNAVSYIPNRTEEGYGLNIAGIEKLAQAGADVLLTVDCGIANIEEVEKARGIGMTTIVTDHHIPGNSLPKADAIVDPMLNDCPYPNVAGVGVIFLLMAALNKEICSGSFDIRQYLDLVALGSIADMVNLTRENRIMVKNGLLLLKEAKRPGIFALKEISDLPPTSNVDSGAVGFSLAPRLNAAGRLGDPETALELLLAEDLSTARPLAAKLEKYNQDRRKLEDQILEEALELAREQEQKQGIVLYKPEWHQGVTGIVASRVAEKYYRPTILLSKEGEVLKGSGRSVPECDLYQALYDCGGHLEEFGGHVQAAGVSLNEQDLDAFRSSFNQALIDQLGTEIPAPRLNLEAKLGLKMIDLNLVQEIDMLQPFGPGNPQPLFCSKSLYVRNQRKFGQNHLSLELRDTEAGVTMLGKLWHQAHIWGQELKGRNVQLAFTPRLNHYNGLISIDLHVKDLCTI